jgi:mono/diheme cytochrome c family protein
MTFWKANPVVAVVRCLCQRSEGLQAAPLQCPTIQCCPLKMPTALEIKAAKTAVLTSVLVLTVTFVAGGIYWQHTGRLEQARPLDVSVAIVAQGRSSYLKSCAHCHGKDADGGEDAPSLQKLSISPAHMTLVIQNGIKGDMPSFAKKYSDADVQKIVAYLQTLR